MGGAEHGTPGIKPRACLQRGARQAPRIAQGLDRAGAPIPQRACVHIGAQFGRRVRSAQDQHRDSPHPPLRSAALDILESPVADRAMQSSGAFRLAQNAVAIDQFKDQVRRIAKHTKQTLSVVCAQRCDNLIRGHPHTGIDQADVASGSAESDILRFQDDDRCSSLRQVKRRRQSGVAGAYHHHVRRNRVANHLGHRRRARGVVP